jgi:hypothetical protein
MNNYTFHIGSTAVIEAPDENTARETLEEIIADWRQATGDDQVVLDDILAGAQVGEMIAEEPV